MFDSGWFSGALCTCQPESFFGFCKAISNSQQESHALSKPRERGSAKAVAPWRGWAWPADCGPAEPVKAHFTSSCLRKRQRVQGSSGQRHGCSRTQQGRGRAGSAGEMWEAKCASATGRPAVSEGAEAFKSPLGFPTWEFSFHGDPHRLPRCSSRLATSAPGS